MRVCYWGTYDASYVRNRVLIRGLRLAGAEVSEQHANLWSARDERVREASRRSPSLALVVRAAWAYLRLSVRLLATRRPDVVIVGYPGQVDVLVARVLCWIRRIPLVFDAYLSAYETAVIDRGLLSPRSFQARVLRHVERLGCRLADLVLLDTEADCGYFRHEYGAGRYARVWVGADEPSIVPEPHSASHQFFDVLFAGTFIPLHGVEHILRAAEILQRSAPDVRITLIGSGQTYAAMRRLATVLQLRNVEWGAEWLTQQALAERMARADLVLGVFGTSAKAQRVIPAKAYAALALGRPLLTADTPGAREALVDHETAFFCAAGDAAALAEAIIAIRDDPVLAESVGAQGHALFEACFSPAAVGTQLMKLLCQLVSQ